MQGVTQHYRLPLYGLWSLLLGIAGCGGPTPEDQFKMVSDEMKPTLIAFLEGKQSKVMEYKATVTKESDVDQRGDHTHVAVIRFVYPVTQPEGESNSPTLNTAAAKYHFATKEKKWVYVTCEIEKGTGYAYPKAGVLVTYPEILTFFSNAKLSD